MTVSYSLAVDIGGTFTDVVLRALRGRARPSTRRSPRPHDLLEGFFAGV